MIFMQYLQLIMEKILFRKIILEHFIILDLLNKFRVSKKNISIEMIKILLLFKLIHNKKY